MTVLKWLGAFSLVVVLAVTFVGGSEGAELGRRPLPSALEQPGGADDLRWNNTFANLSHDINIDGHANFHIPRTAKFRVSGARCSA